MLASRRPDSYYRGGPLSIDIPMINIQRLSRWSNGTFEFLYVEGSSPNILERCDPRMRICEYLPAVNASRVQ